MDNQPNWLDGIEPNDAALTGLINGTRKSFEEEMGAFAHPLQFKLYLRRFFEGFKTIDPDGSAPLPIAAAMSAIQSSLLGAWFAAFRERFNRSPAPSEVYDPMERGLSPGVDWASIDAEEYDRMTDLGLVDAVDAVTDTWDYAIPWQNFEYHIHKTPSTEQPRTEGGES